MGELTREARAPRPLSAAGAAMFEGIREAARRLQGAARRTPVVTSRTLDSRVGAHVFLKCENFQRTGAFKFRGAYNAVARLDREQRARGVLTYSSGNHAQALALVGRLLGVRTTVVMPADAPSTKRAATEGYGAAVVEYDPRTATREELAGELAERSGAVVVPPYDHPDVIAGQGTATLEFVHQARDLDLLLVPCGGGGLLSGAVVACRSRNPACRVVGVEPALADDATRSFRHGVLHSVHSPPTVADGLRTPSLGRFTFPLIRDHVDDMVTVSEEAIAAAVRFLFHRMRMVVEPSGAVGVADLHSGAAVRGRVGVLLSGGNVDGTTMARILTKPQEGSVK